MVKRPRVSLIDLLVRFMNLLETFLRKDYQEIAKQQHPIPIVNTSVSIYRSMQRDAQLRRGLISYVKSKRRSSAK